MTFLSSLLGRQLSAAYSRRALVDDSFLSDLSCLREDDHTSEAYAAELEGPPFTCKFHKSLLHGQLFAVGNEEGRVTLIDSRRSGQDAVVKEWTAHTNSIFDIAWMNNEPKIVTASGDQSAHLWDAQDGRSLAIFRGHTCSLKSVNVRDSSAAVFATGARDGNIMLWDTRCQPRDGHHVPVNIIRDAHVQKTRASNQKQRRVRNRRGLPVTIATYDSQQSVTAVLFQDDHTLISAGAMDGNIKIWDLRRNYSSTQSVPIPQHVFPYPGNRTRTHGYSSLVLDSTKTKLFANCTDGNIYQFECAGISTGSLCSYSGHLNTSFFVKSVLSPNNTFLMSGSSNYDVFIWKVSEPSAPPHCLTGHNGEVTGVAWCPTEQTKVVSCSDDGSTRVWRVNKHLQPDDKDKFVGWSKRYSSNQNVPAAPSQQRKEMRLTRIYTNPRLNSPTNPISSAGGILDSEPCASPRTPKVSCLRSVPASPVTKTQRMKCESPEQFMQTWLRGSRKRSRPDPDSEQADQQPPKMNKLDSETDHNLSPLSTRPGAASKCDKTPTSRKGQKILGSETSQVETEIQTTKDQDRTVLATVDNLIKKVIQNASKQAPNKQLIYPAEPQENNHTEKELKENTNWLSKVSIKSEEEDVELRTKSLVCVLTDINHVDSKLLSPQRMTKLNSSSQKESPGKSRYIFDYFKPIAVESSEEELDSPSKDAQR